MTKKERKIGKKLNGFLMGAVIGGAIGSVIGMRLNSEKKPAEQGKIRKFFKRKRGSETEDFVFQNEELKKIPHE